MASSNDNGNDGRVPVRKELSIFEIDGRDVPLDVDRLNLKVLNAQEVAHLCSDSKSNRKAAMVCSLAYTEVKGLDAVVYVATTASRKASKVGLSNNPYKRMEQLQVGSHEQLSFTHLFWLPRACAKGLERFTLRVAGRLGARLSGEWVDLQADELATMIATLAVEGNMPLATSEMFTRNMAATLSAGGREFDSRGYSGTPFDVLSARGA